MMPNPVARETEAASLIFVYGTLKTGCCNAHYLAEQRLLGRARTRPFYQMVDCGGFPGLFPVEKDGRAIAGEVWEIDLPCRQQLDVLEAVDQGEYERQPVALEPPFASQEIFTYFYQFPQAGLPDAGIEWRETNENKA